MDDLALAKPARLFLYRPGSAQEVPLSTTARAVRCAKRRSRPSHIQWDHSTANVSALACPPFCQQALSASSRLAFRPRQTVLPSLLCDVHLEKMRANVAVAGFFMVMSLRPSSIANPVIALQTFLN